MIWSDNTILTNIFREKLDIPFLRIAVFSLTKVKTSVTYRKSTILQTKCNFNVSSKYYSRRIINTVINVGQYIVQLQVYFELFSIVLKFEFM